MANYNTLITAIQQAIRTNGNNEITGALLQQSLLSMINSLGVGYQFMGVATPSTNPGTPDQKVFYFSSTAGTYSNFNGIVIANNEFAILYYDTEWSKTSMNIPTKIEVEEIANNLNGKVPIDNDSKTFIRDKSDTLYVADGDGNIIAYIDNTGLHTTKLHSLTQDFQSLEYIMSQYKDTLYVADGDGNIMLKLNQSGFICPPIQNNDWYNKCAAAYGDSITAITNGDFEKPILTGGNNWGTYFAAKKSMRKFYGRGIGSTLVAWGTDSGPISWCTPTGLFINRKDNFTYDNFDNVSYPTGVTAEMEQAGTAIRTRGNFCSWLRIKTMFPEIIKDSIDVVFVMGGTNDFYNDIDISTDAMWVANDTTDPEWANDSIYYKGGDYNLHTFKGAIASILMKMHYWMPNSLIVMCTPLSGNYRNNTTDNFLFDVVNNKTMRDYANAMIDVAQKFSCPIIDVNGQTTISPFNREGIITDGIHPYSVSGGKLIGRVFCSGLNTIVPFLK